MSPPHSSPSILSLILILSLTAAAAESPAPVLDVAGKPLRSGTLYHILPVMRGRGGGLTLGSTGSNKTSCPLDVVQAGFEVSAGLPLTFHPVNAKEGVVRVSTDHNIKFSGAPICVRSAVWKLDYDEAAQKFFVAAGGVEGNPGRETTSNWFKIEEYDGDYKLVFCPTVCDYCKVICRDVVVSVEGGRRRLGVNLQVQGAPFRVMFRKA